LPSGCSVCITDDKCQGRCHLGDECQCICLLDAACYRICLPDGVWQGIFFLDAWCQGIFLLDASVSGYFPSGHSCIRAFSFWTQPCQGIFLLDTRCQGIFLLDARCQGVFLLDAAVSGHFPSRRSRVRAFSFWTQLYQGIFLLDAAVSGYFPSGHMVLGHFPSGYTVSGHFSSGRSRVRAFSFWTQLCQGIFLLDTVMSGQMVSGQCVLWHHGYPSCQGTEHRSKYSRRIHKHAVGSRHSDSVQFYSLYLMYIYICYYHTSCFQYKHPVSHPSPRSSHVVMLF